MSQSNLPAHAKVVIVGGGVMGCGLAYHLAHEGCSDVVLLGKSGTHIRINMARRGANHPFHQLVWLG